MSSSALQVTDTFLAPSSKRCLVCKAHAPLASRSATDTLIKLRRIKNMAVANVLEQSKQGKVALESKRWLRHESAFQTHIESDKLAMFHFSLMVYAVTLTSANCASKLPKICQTACETAAHRSTWGAAQSKGHLGQPNPTFLEQRNLRIYNLGIPWNSHSEPTVTV